MKTHEMAILVQNSAKEERQEDCPTSTPYIYIYVHVVSTILIGYTTMQDECSVFVCFHPCLFSILLTGPCLP